MLTTTRQFLAQAVVMTLNQSLSIPNALKARSSGRLLREHRDHRMAARAGRRGLSRSGVRSNGAVVFKDGRNVETAKEFVRFLVAEGWLAHYLDFAGDRMLPPMPKLLDAAVLARPERPAPDDRCDADRIATNALLRGTFSDWRQRLGLGGTDLGPKRSIAWPPRASAPSRRSTRRSSGSRRCLANSFGTPAVQEYSSIQVSSCAGLSDAGAVVRACGHRGRRPTSAKARNRGDVAGAIDGAGLWGLEVGGEGGGVALARPEWSPGPARMGAPLALHARSAGKRVR